MTMCWKENPADRPNFKSLKKIFGEMLDSEQMFKVIYTVNKNGSITRLVFVSCECVVTKF